MQVFVTTLKYVAPVLVVVSCKPNADSKLKTLDQFAGGGRSYACNGSFTDNTRYLSFVRGIKSEDQKKAVENALSAVPGHIKERIFFGPAKSFVEITDNIGSKCHGSSTVKANSQQKSSIYSCPVIQNGDAIVFVDKNPTRIQSSLVRGLAYYMIQIDSKFEKQLSSPSKMVVGYVDQGDLTKSKQYQGALVFLDEVAAGGGLKVFSHLLPAAVLNAKDKRERDAAFFDIRKTNASDRDAFVSYFLAEMMDSSFCSDETRKVVANKFPKTFAFFSPDAKASGFALSEGGSVASSDSAVVTTDSRASISTRSQSDESPIGLVDSNRMMYVVSSDGKETPTKLFYDKADNTQTWRDPNSGVWKQSPIPKLNGPEENVGTMAEAPMFAEAPPVTPLPRPQQGPSSGQQSGSSVDSAFNYTPATMQSTLPAAIITTGGNSIPSTSFPNPSYFSQNSFNGFQSGVVGSTYSPTLSLQTNSWLSSGSTSSGSPTGSPPGSGTIITNGSGSPTGSGTIITSGSGMPPVQPSVSQTTQKQSAWCRYLGWWCGGTTSGGGGGSGW
jgi:hypothetical protein